MKCICCKKDDGKYFHFDGGKVCDHCLGHYFTCSKCGMLFNQDDYVNGDQGTGYCKKCSQEDE